MAGRDKKRPAIFQLYSAITPGTEPLMKRVQLTLSAAQLNNLFTNHVEILPAPGPGKYYSPVIAVAQMHPGTVAFSLNGNGTLRDDYPAAYPGITIPLPNLLDTLTPNISSAAAFMIGANQATQVDMPLKLQTDTADMSDGDGTLTLILYYTTETIV
jgi:hypothetical protein